MIDHALTTWISCTDHVAEHALFTWLITHLQNLKEYEETLLTGWYLEETSDQKLKAMVYANLICTGEDIALEDIVILLHQTEGDRAFIAFVIDRTSQTLVFRDKGIDTLGDIDFAFSYRYAGEYLSY